MISSGEVITKTSISDEFTTIMLGEGWWDMLPMHWWEDIYPHPTKTIKAGRLISSGEIIRDAERMDDFLEVMTGCRFGFCEDRKERQSPCSHYGSMGCKQGERNASTLRQSR